MANALYAKGREGFLDGSIDWDSDNIKVVLVDVADYTIDLATHDNLDDIPSGARVATSANLSGKTVTDGVADATNVTFTAVSGVGVTNLDLIVIYQDSGSPSTSRLICAIDDATGLPVVPNGGDITIAWDDGANKIFKL